MFFVRFFVEPGGGGIFCLSLVSASTSAWLNAFSCRSSIKHRYLTCTLIDIVVCDSSLVLMSWFSCYRYISCFDVCSFLLLYDSVSFFFPPNPSARSLLRRIDAVPPPAGNIFFEEGDPPLFSRCFVYAPLSQLPFSV